MTVADASSPDRRNIVKDVLAETSAMMSGSPLASGTYSDKTADYGRRINGTTTPGKMSSAAAAANGYHGGIPLTATESTEFTSNRTPRSSPSSSTGAATVAATQFLPSADAAVNATQQQEFSIRSAATPSQMSPAHHGSYGGNNAGGGGVGVGGDCSLYSMMDDSIAGEMLDMSALANRSHLNTTTNATMLSMQDAGTPSQMSLAPAGVASPSFQSSGSPSASYQQHMSNMSTSSSLRDASTSPASPSPRPSPSKSSFPGAPAPLLGAPVAATPSPSRSGLGGGGGGGGGPGDNLVPTPPTFGTVDSGSLIQASSRMMGASDTSFLGSPPYANAPIGLSAKMEEASRADDAGAGAGAAQDTSRDTSQDLNNTSNANDVSAVSGLTGNSHYAPSAPGDGSACADASQSGVFSNSASFCSHSAAAVRSNATTVVQSNTGPPKKSSKSGRFGRLAGSSKSGGSGATAADGSFPSMDKNEDFRDDDQDGGGKKAPLPGERIPPPGSTLKRENRKRKCWRYGICAGLLLGVVAIVLGSLALTDNLGGGGQDSRQGLAAGAAAEGGGTVGSAGDGGERPGTPAPSDGGGGDDDPAEIEPAQDEESEDETESVSDDENEATTTSTTTTDAAVAAATSTTLSSAATTEAEVVPTPGPTNSPTDKPTLVPTPAPTPPSAVLASALTQYADIDSAALSTQGSPQNLALAWLANDAVSLKLELGGQTTGDEGDDTNGEAVERLAQRFAAATVGFALGVPPGTRSDRNDWDGDDDRRVVVRERRGLGGGGSETTTADVPKSGWLSLEDECSWPGVECGKHPLGYDFKVPTEFNLARMSAHDDDDGGETTQAAQTTRVIPPEIGLFKHLKRLDLAENGLVGPIPGALYNLVELEGLFLERNELSGNLGPGIGQLTRLVDLFLGNNKLDGPVPKKLTKLRVLRNLILHRNSFTGPFPLLRLRELHYLDVSYNALTGPLPADLADYATLRIAFLDHNGFQGEIPSDYPDIGKGRMMELTLDHNKLCGGVPGGWMQDMKYQKFLLAVTFHNNYLTSRIPDELCALSVLGGTGELIQLSTDCSVCKCSSRENLCGGEQGRCERGYDDIDDDEMERECERFEEERKAAGDGGRA